MAEDSDSYDTGTDDEIEPQSNPRNSVNVWSLPSDSNTIDSSLILKQVQQQSQSMGYIQQSSQQHSSNMYPYYPPNYNMYNHQRQQQQQHSNQYIPPNNHLLSPQYQTQQFQFNTPPNNILQQMQQQSHSAIQLNNNNNYMHNNTNMQYQPHPPPNILQQMQQQSHSVMQLNNNNNYIPPKHPFMLQQSQTAIAHQQMISIQNTASMRDIYQSQAKNIRQFNGSAPNLNNRNMNINNRNCYNGYNGYNNYNNYNNNNKQNNINMNESFVPPPPQSTNEIKKYENWKTQRKLKDEQKTIEM
eukprot:216675_1